jgi:hypothetical protein
MSFYDRMQNIATGLLARFDQGGLSLDRYTAGDGPAYAPGQPAYTPQAFSGVARGVTAEHLRDSLVQASDLYVTMPASMMPTLKDRVTVSGRSNQVVKIIRLPAAGTVVAWQVIVRS